MKHMKQMLKQFSITMRNNSLFCIVVMLFSMLFPCMNILFFTFFDSLNMYYFLWIGFYSIIGNIIIFHKNKLLSSVFIIINIAALSIWYLVSLMGYWEGVRISFFSSVIPFFIFFVHFFDNT